MKTAQICSHHGDTSAKIIARGLCAEPNSSSAKAVPEPRTLWKILLMGKKKSLQTAQIRLQTDFLAQREGFEPSWDCSQTDFESAPL